jgi:hypothetical protein
MTCTILCRKHGLPAAYDYMKTAGHKELYARDVLTLNEAAMAKVSPYTILVSLYLIVLTLVYVHQHCRS